MFTCEDPKVSQCNFLRSRCVHRPGQYSSEQARKLSGEGRIVASILLITVIMFTCAASLLAQTTCTPRFGGGYNCYSHGSGSSSTITPRFGGGYSTYDYGTGHSGAITPRFGGGYNTYDYGTGRSGTITPRFGGGFNVDE
jgi:hypothetical protein